MSRLLTWVLRLLPVLGLVLVVIGSQELYPVTWLDSKGFVINLASSATAACFGIWIAYFVLQGLLREREDTARRRRLKRGAVRAVTQLRYALVPNCTLGMTWFEISEAKSILGKKTEELREARVRALSSMRDRQLAVVEVKALLRLSESTVNLDLYHRINTFSQPIDEAGTALGLTAFLRNANGNFINEDLQPLPESALTAIEAVLRPDDALLRDFRGAHDSFQVHWEQVKDGLRSLVAFEDRCLRVATFDFFRFGKPDPSMHPLLERAENAAKFEALIDERRARDSLYEQTEWSVEKIQELEEGLLRTVSQLTQYERVFDALNVLEDSLDLPDSSSPRVMRTTP